MLFEIDEAMGLYHSQLLSYISFSVEIYSSIIMQKSDHVFQAVMHESNLKLYTFLVLFSSTKR